MRTRIAIVGALCIAGCAGSPASRQAPDLRQHVERIAHEGYVTCRRETPAGSRVPRRVCRSAEQERERQERTAEFMVELRRSSPGNAPR